jgi:hypothetical protein
MIAANRDAWTFAKTSEKPRRNPSASTAKHDRAMPKHVSRQRIPPSLRGRKTESEAGQNQPFWKLLAGKNRNIRVTLPQRLVEKLNQEARRYRRTRQEIVRIACEDWISKKENHQ